MFCLCPLLKTLDLRTVTLHDAEVLPEIVILINTVLLFAVYAMVTLLQSSEEVQWS